jgi:hypothetical protein
MSRESGGSQRRGVICASLDRRDQSASAEAKSANGSLQCALGALTVNVRGGHDLRSCDSARGREGAGGRIAIGATGTVRRCVAVACSVGEQKLRGDGAELMLKLRVVVCAECRVTVPCALESHRHGCLAAVMMGRNPASRRRAVREKSIRAGRLRRSRRVANHDVTKNIGGARNAVREAEGVCDGFSAQFGEVNLRRAAKSSSAAGRRCGQFVDRSWSTMASAW